ncbi:MAG: 50S ribosomal protein L11 methyltransferase [Cytophagales bacterium]|nr:50S ribosomal protein L11 methyltransferase [Cytophagales bacterium]MDW8385281.1 50S ribosomal protein L11 methyltransferase [Flammeovirgaceae bacterium]
MNYVCLSVRVKEPSMREILVAELSEIGFDMFSETEDLLETSVRIEHFQENELKEIMNQYQIEEFEYTVVENQNWNQLWESHYPYVEISSECVVRALFHQLEKSYPYEIIIQPKMSFGTGHHATTVLMMRAILQMDCSHKDVLDAGCGTGILGILALKKGARSVVANDIEEWTVENALENAFANKVELQVVLGDIYAVGSLQKTFDIILANINLHVILEELPCYITLLRPEGKLLLSGFYVSDIPLIERKLTSLHRKITSVNTLENWACLLIG